MAQKVHLSKSRYCLGKNCVKALYLQVREPDKASALTEADRMILDQGTAVGELARDLYPSGRFVNFGTNQLDKAIEETNKLLNDRSVPAIFEATFAFEDILIRADILVRLNDSTWNLYEVKSSTKVKEDHIDDTSVQTWVIRKCGVQLQNVFVKLIDTEKTYSDLPNIFYDADVIEDVNSVIGEVDDIASLLKEALAKSTEPDVPIGVQCLQPRECSFKNYCWEGVPKHSVLELNRMKYDERFELYNSGVKLISKLSPKVKLNSLQRKQMKAVTTKSPVIDIDGLRDALKESEGPKLFLDFETINPAIPLFPGSKPYEQIPVQFTAIQWDNKIIETRNFVFSGDGSPHEECSRALAEILKDFSGMLVAYSASFEKRMLKSLSQVDSSHSHVFESATERFWDLEVVFKKFYFHPDFRGSTSIKNVLPVFKPDLNYKHLKIQNGVEAQVALISLVKGDLLEDEKKELREALIAYCHQDVYAMVVLYEALLTMCATE